MTSGEPGNAPNRLYGSMAGRLPAALPLTLLAQHAEEHAATFLGLPLWIWQLANLVLFLGVLLYFVARPMAAMFRQRQLDVEKRLAEAKALREEASSRRRSSPRSSRRSGPAATRRGRRSGRHSRSARTARSSASARKLNRK